MAVFSPNHELTHKLTATCVVKANESAVKSSGLAARHKLNKERFLSTINSFHVLPIQGEGWFIVPPFSYLANIRELCTRNKIYLVLNEIQTRYGRTDKF
ncbi:acetylornithine aminotransferase [Schizosaccharomyces octosporus yFS286]|uniref:Acetylornithine aminotransferase n=1 Tax=Schizosaccharomyces octosporus (strain yFS286) TaxID=483514 RepID=S9PTG8_SCHOY|nr:acetylornithine aminotransferase [Schizosaccharomyces octosporus yFS286]EPX70798.1 acetylornithine aminotransferase [Schizosaccharomyces octosporus yFS286]